MPNRPFKLRALLFLYSNANLAGCAAALLGPALLFAGVIDQGWLAITAGFVGVLIIVRPGIEGFDRFSLLALVSVVFCALRDLATRRIPARIPSRIFDSFLRQ